MFIRTVFLIMLAAMAAVPIGAQELRGMIFGWVLDPQAMPVAGAAITITNVNTRTVTARQTNATGYYEANLLLSGDYEVSVEAAGFKRSVRRGITLPVGTRTQIDMKLEIGAVTESVAVTADAPLLETNAVSSGRVMDSKTLTAVPTQNRNTMLLARWAPGVQSNGVNELASVYNTSTNQYGHVAGRVGGNEWSVDGMPNLGIGRQAAEQPFTDIIEEFKVETSAFDASVGHTLGLSVSMKTKSGSNAVHGSLGHIHWQQRWQGAGFFVKQVYYRNIADAETRGDTARAAALRAQDKQPSGHSNNYGASIGGPVVIPKLYDGRNKLFFFFAFNGLKDIKSTPPGMVNRTVPTLANRQGDFSQLLQVDATRYQIYDPLSIQADPARATHFIRTPIPGNIIPASRITNPGYATYAKFLPAPNNDPLTPRTEPRNNYLAVGLPSNAEFKAYTNRIDYNPSEKHRFFGRWGWQRSLEPRNDWTYESAPGLHDQFFQRTYRNAIADWIYIQSAATVWDVAVSVTETKRKFDLTVPFDYKPSSVGLPTYVDEKAGGLAVLPMMAFTGYEALGQFPTPTVRLYMPSVKAEVSHVRGQHTVRAGFDSRHAFHNGGVAVNSSGSFGFTNLFTRRNDDTFTPAGDLGLSWAAFMLGIPDGLTIGTEDTFAVKSPYYGWYVQDNWRVSPKLSINLGFRMEYEQGPTERYNRILGHFDPGPKLPFTDAVEAAYARAPVPELPAANFMASGGSLYAGSAGAGRRFLRNEMMYLPRAAVAYQIASKTVLRAGYGMYFDTTNVMNLGFDQTGFSRTTSTNVTNDFGMTWLAGNPRAGVSPLRDPFPLRADGSRFDMPVRDALGLSARAGRGWTYNGFDLRHARQHRWRAGVQRQIGTTMVVEAAYAAMYTDRVPISQTQSPLPENFWAGGNTRNDTIANNMNANVANPFIISNLASLRTSAPLVYSDLATQGFFTSGTIRKNQLLRPYPHMNGLTNRMRAVGKARSDALETSFQRRFSKGFNFNLSYTLLRAREADFFYNEFDALPSWRTSNDGRPHRFLATTVFELPFGKGRRFASSGPVAAIAGGFQIALAYEFQPGPLLAWNNLFFNGNLEGISNVDRTLDSWFNTNGFERVAARGPAAFHRRVFPTVVDGVRADMTKDLHASLSRNIAIRESVNLLLRLDVMNVQNRSQFAAPSTNPVASDFGRVTSQTLALNRFIQIQAKLVF